MSLWVSDSRGEVASDQVSQYTETWSCIWPGFPIHRNLVMYMTKFPSIRPSLKPKNSKKALRKHLSKKTLLEDLAIFLNCFCAKDGTSSSKTVGGDRFFYSFWARSPIFCTEANKNKMEGPLGTFF